MKARIPHPRTIISLSLLLASQGLNAQAPSTSGGFQAGPVYTSEDTGKDLPVYPRIDIVLRPGQADSGKLTPGDFKLVEDGTETGEAEQMRSFGDAGYGIEAIMAIDCSGSMRGRPLGILRDSLYRFVNDARPQDKIGVITFADETRFDVPFDASRATLKDRLAKVSGRGRETHLYDALLDALADFDGSVTRRELIVVSDGHDEGSKHTLDAVIQQARKLNIAIDSVGVSRSNPVYLRSLQQISAQTGGGYRLAKDDAELQTLIAHAIGQMKQEPVASFAVKHLPRDGKEHPIQVRWLSANLTADAVLPAIASAGLAGVLSGHVRWTVAGVLLLLGVGGLLWWKSRPSEVQIPAANAEPYQVQRGESLPEQAAGPHPETRWESQRIPTIAQKPDPQPAAAPPPVAARTQMVALYEPARSSKDGDPTALAWLDVVEGPRQGERIAIHTTVFRIGAAQDNHLALAGDPTLSGHHAVLIGESRIWMVQDAGSTNGTFVNEQRLADARRSLGPGDRIRMGRSVFRVIGGTS